MEDLLLLYLFSKGFTLNSSELTILAIFSVLFSRTVISIFFLHSEHLGGSSTRTRQVSINGKTKLMIGKIIIFNVSVVLLILIGSSKFHVINLFLIFSDLKVLQSYWQVFLTMGHMPVMTDEFRLQDNTLCHQGTFHPTNKHYP